MEVGILCSYIPIEIIMAAGFTPTRIIPSAHSQEGSVLLDANYCPYILSLLSEAMNGAYDSLTGMIFANSCDGMRRLYDVWRIKIKKPEFLYFMNLPFSRNLKLFLRETEKLINALEKRLSVSITPEKLADAIKLSNEQRANMLNHKNRPTHGKRILVSGTVLEAAELENMLPDASIIYEDLCNSGRSSEIQIDESEEPLHAIAKAYMERIPCPRMNLTEEKANMLIDKVKKTHADGVILYGLKFCDTFLFSAPRIKNKLKECGIPVLVVDGWFKPGTLAGLKTRVQAFMEMLNE